MEQTLKKILKYLIPQFTFLQKFYRGIYYIGIWGMNYGVEGSIKETGELKAIKKLKKYWSNSPILFDVGANIGNYTKFLKTQIGGHGKIFSFEPLGSTYSKLVSNVESENIFSFNVGFSDKEGEEILFFDSSRPSQASVIKLDVSHLNQNNSQHEKIKLTTLDSFCEQNKIDKIDLLKIDVEGNELRVFQGANRLLREKKIQTIQFEFGTTQIDAKVFFKDFWNLLHHDFRIYRILRNNLFEITFYTESLEVFHFSNFVAIQKELTKS